MPDVSPTPYCLIVQRHWVVSCSVKTRTCSAKRPSGSSRVGRLRSIYAHQLKVTIGRCVGDLERLAHAGAPEDFANRVQYLPAHNPP